MKKKILYGLLVGGLVVAVIKKRWSETQKWGWLSALNFMLPQVYILVAANHVPKDVYIIIFSVIGVMAAFAALGVVSQIRAARKEKSAE